MSDHEARPGAGQSSLRNDGEAIPCVEAPSAPSQEARPEEGVEAQEEGTGLTVEVPCDAHAFGYATAPRKKSRLFAWLDLHAAYVQGTQFNNCWS